MPHLVSFGSSEQMGLRDFRGKGKTLDQVRKVADFGMLRKDPRKVEAVRIIDIVVDAT
jgi:hypothetical protein